MAAVGQSYPNAWERLGNATPNLLTYLGLASLLGVLGSWLLARRVKRQTLGLEPQEIAEVVEHREAMLEGIKEGVLGLDLQHRITLVNDAARRLLDLPDDCVGRTFEALNPDRRLRDVLTGQAEGPDEVVIVGERVLMFNRRPISAHSRVVGSVTTLRDRTELMSLQHELGATRNTTDVLRAQAHEFANQLHTISGLIQLGEHAEVVRFINMLGQTRAQLTDDVTSRIADPALAALLIAKGSQATERGLELRISEQTRLPRIDEQLGADLTTIVGNLVDNALDAIGPIADGWIEVDLREADGGICLVVRDSGPGVAPELAEEVFRHGFTTKVVAQDGQRGFGLALTQLVCARRGGEVSVHNDQGAVFTARIPITREVRA